jgi:pimeloyl-ACP methyl ester carboxylesterase
MVVDPISVIREGSGPEVLLVHGGASPRTTWGGLESLKPRGTLALVHRRGYPPSPPHRVPATTSTSTLPTSHRCFRRARTSSRTHMVCWGR